MSNNQNNLKSRRAFLNHSMKAMSLPILSSPLQVLIQSIVLGSVRNVMAADTGVSPRKYLYIVQQSAPPRWTYDLFLTPYSDKGFIANSGLGTFFDNGVLGYKTVEKNINGKKINVPYMWSFDVPAVGGGWRSMDSLLENLLQIRGIDVGNPDHAAAQALQFMPLGASQSMPALAADASVAPIAAVSVGVSEFKMKSVKSKTAVGLSLDNSPNLLENLLSPFNRKDLGVFSLNRQKLGSDLDSCISTLNQSASAFHPQAQSVTEATKMAKDLLSTGFGNLSTIWTDLNSKYKDLIRRSIDPTRNILGINDREVLSDGTAKFQLNKVIITKNTDIRTLVKANTTINSLVAIFSLSEYILVNNLSSSVSVGIGLLSNLNLNNINSQLFTDEHDTSGAVSMYLNTILSMAYAACMVELVDRLKAKDIFKETVIVTGGEFGRNPRGSSEGSDHGYRGSSSSIYSGAITSPLILGNIKNGKTSGDYLGTWGEGATVAELGKQVDLGHWASTIATLLRVPSPITASQSLVAVVNGKVIPLVELAKQV